MSEAEKAQVEGFLRGANKMFTLNMSLAGKAPTRRNMLQYLKVAKWHASNINEYETKLGLAKTKFYFTN